jgi:hypothetical protein
MKGPHLSARKQVVLGNSPHPVSTERPVLPHPSRKLKNFANTGPEDALAIAREEFRRNRFVGHGENYGTIFLHAGDRFWEQVQALRNIERTELDRRKLVLGRRTLESVNWHASLPIQSGRFVRAFIEAVRDRHFPKRRKTQARFLGDSLGADGELSARRSRDICEEQRAIQKRTHHIIRYEFYIECSCQFKGHSLDHACPNCGAEIGLPDSFLGSNKIDIY